MKALLRVLILLVLFSCGKDDGSGVISTDETQELTIFYINDPHSQLTNFAKIKHIVDEAKQETNVLLVAAGDIFSGSPYVDQYEPKGYPIIDVMNRTGFDVAVIGNHEFDYGLSTLEDRINQSTFPWICANVDAESSALTQPEPFITLTSGELSITFLGLVETGGHPTRVIPATHPWRVTDISFQAHQDVVNQFSDLKQQEDADLYVALTHLGLFADQQLATDFPFFDVIIGGHSNHLNETETNGIPTLMAGRNLSHLGRIDLEIRNQQVINYITSLISLTTYPDEDTELMNVISSYETNPVFDEVIGSAQSHHDRTEVGCFYTEALRSYMNVDMSFQNHGGIRSELAQGDITPFHIYSIDPFNNGSVVFTRTAREIKNFFMQTGQGLHVSGVTMENDVQDIIMRDEFDNEISDETIMTIGINDYLPALYEDYFPLEDAEIRTLTTAESIIQHLKNSQTPVDYEGCNHFFRF